MICETKTSLGYEPNLGEVFYDMIHTILDHSKMDEKVIIIFSETYVGLSDLYQRS